MLSIKQNRIEILYVITGRIDPKNIEEGQMVEDIKIEANLY